MANVCLLKSLQIHKFADLRTQISTIDKFLTFSNYQISEMAQVKPIFQHSLFDSFRESSPVRLFDAFREPCIDKQEKQKERQKEKEKESTNFSIGDKVFYSELRNNSQLDTKATIGMVGLGYLYLTFGTIGAFQVRKVTFDQLNSLTRIPLDEIENSKEIKKEKENISIFDKLNQETRPGWSCYETMPNNRAVKALSESLKIGTISEETCLYMIQGKCRFKKYCKASHGLVCCPFCQLPLPSYKVSASAHLRRCYRSFSEDLDEIVRHEN